MRNSPDIATIIQPFEQGSSEEREPERRQFQRWLYPVTQLVAFHREHERPTKDLLQPVRCYDISLGGMSFFLPQPTKHTHCTLVLGRQPGLIFIKARVIHCDPVEPFKQEWKIGCEFLTKLDSFPLRNV